MPAMEGPPALGQRVIIFARAGTESREPGTRDREDGATAGKIAGSQRKTKDATAFSGTRGRIRFQALAAIPASLPDSLRDARRIDSAPASDRTRPGLRC